MQIEWIADCECALGEGPLWHNRDARLYWADILTGRLFRYNPQDNATELFYEGDPIGGFTEQADGSLLLFRERGAIQILRNGELETVHEEIPAERETRFNDVIADPTGRVFCGTIPVLGEPARLYRLDLDGSLHVVSDDVGLSNGMGFTPDRSRMYYTDTYKNAIFLYDYDGASGEITNRRIFHQVTSPEDGLADGLTVDTEGGVWSARHDAGVVIRYHADGTEDLRFTLPAKLVTSLTFGGPDFRDLYITSAGGGDRATHGHGSGVLFRVRPGFTGLPEFVSRIRC